MKFHHIVLTNCTSRKRNGERSLRLDQKMLGDDLPTIATHWISALADHEPKVLVRNMYLGRSMCDAKNVADAMNAALYVVSAGRGLVSGNDEIAPYDLSPSDARNGLQETLTQLGATSAQWWDLLCKGKGVAHLLTEYPNAILLAALPANYVEMLSGDLSSLSIDSIQRLRIFTSHLGKQALPEKLADAVMPYDSRLESIPNYAGTRADFPQRALKHFVESLKAHHLNQDQARQAVRLALMPLQPPRTVERQRVDDAEIKKLIHQNWDIKEGRSTRLLRMLRDDFHISCEQGRFSKLWKAVRDERNSLTVAHRLI